MKIVLAKILLFSRKVSGEYQISSSESQNDLILKPALSGHCIKQTPSIKPTVAEVPKFISLICFK